MNRKIKGQISLDVDKAYPIGDVILNLMSLREQGFTHVMPDITLNFGEKVTAIVLKGTTEEDMWLVRYK